MADEKSNNTIINSYRTKTHTVKVSSNFQSDKKLFDVMHSIATLRLKEQKAYDKLQHRRT